MTSRQNKARSKKKTTADAAVFVVMRRAQQCRPHAVCRRTTVTRAPRSRARLIPVTIRRDSWRSHVHRTRFRRPRSSSSADLPMCGVEGQDPSSFLSGVQGGYSLSRKRVSPFIRAAPPALPSPLRCAQKEKRGPRFRTAPFLCRFSSRSRYCSHSHCCSRSHRRSRRRRRSG